MATITFNSDYPSLVQIEFTYGEPTIVGSYPNVKYRISYNFRYKIVTTAEMTGYPVSYVNALTKSSDYISFYQTGGYSAYFGVNSIDIPWGNAKIFSPVASVGIQYSDDCFFGSTSVTFPGLLLGNSSWSNFSVSSTNKRSITLTNFAFSANPYGAFRMDLYRNDVLIKSDITGSYTDTGLEPNTSYRYQTKVYLRYGNILDGVSAVINAKTSPINQSYVKVGGVYKKGTTYVKVSGAWKLAKSAHVKVNGTWKESI